MNQDASLYGTLLSKGKAVTLPLGPGRHAWVQLVSGTLDANGVKLSPGDGAAISDEAAVTFAAGEDAEFLVFDLA
jgi:redox-sensitive bicupin YhaK (pirin superfamily)